MIACSPLTGRIFSGPVRKTGTGSVFTGNKKDVTSEVLEAIIHKAEFHGGDFMIEANGVPMFRVYVTKLKQTDVPAPAPETNSVKIGGG